MQGCHIHTTFDDFISSSFHSYYTTHTREARIIHLFYYFMDEIARAESPHTHTHKTPLEEAAYTRHHTLYPSLPHLNSFVLSGFACVFINLYLV